MSCEEAQLHKERLQALAEKRKRQAEIEDKRSQLDDLVLQLQHVKSKAMRERWLLQGMGAEEEAARRKQLEHDEEHGKKLEDMIHRLESEIGALESEESQISAKEQVLRERLRETECSIEDLQKSLMAQDEDVTGRMSTTLSDCMDPDPNHLDPAAQLRSGPAVSGEHSMSRPGLSQIPGVTMTTMDISESPFPSRQPHTGMTPWRVVEDVSDKAPRERTLKSVSFQESVSFISDGPAIMEQESQQIQHGCHSSKTAQTPDSEVVQEICYLDQVLDAASANGNPSPTEHIKPISVNGAAPSVCVSACFPTNHQSVVVEGQRQSTFIHQGESAVRTNGHVQDDEPGRNAAKFELRAFHEEKRPAKLFTPGEEQQVRVTRRRPSEEVNQTDV